MDDDDDDDDDNKIDTGVLGYVPIADSQVWLGLPTGRFQSGGDLWISTVSER